MISETLDNQWRCISLLHISLTRPGQITQKSTAKDRDVVKDAELFIIYNNDNTYFHTGGEYIRFWMSEMSLNILNKLFGLLREASYKVTV